MNINTQPDLTRSSVPDLFGGLLIGGAILWCYGYVEDVFDNWVLTNSGALLLPTLVSTLMLAAYPQPVSWSPT